MFAKLLLFFTTLFSVFNPNNTRFNASDIVKPSYNLSVDTGSNEFIVKVNLYWSGGGFANTGSFPLKSKYNTDSAIFRNNEVLPSIYSQFWWSIPCSNPVASGTTNINLTNFQSYSYDSTLKTFTYNFALTNISISGVVRIIKGDTNEQVATEDMATITNDIDDVNNFFTSSALSNYLNRNVFNAVDIGYRYNFWLGGSYNSLSSMNNPLYQITSGGVVNSTLMIYPEDYNIQTTKYLINASYSNNGENGFYNSLISYSSTRNYELNHVPTIAELSMQYTSQSSFNLSTYRLSNSSFVDIVNHTANLYFYILPNTNREVVDIWGLAFSMITLPFTFFSTAFNLTIFEGTPYAFNFSWFLVSVLCVLVLITLIRLVLMFRK